MVRQAASYQSVLTSGFCADITTPFVTGSQQEVSVSREAKDRACTMLHGRPREEQPLPYGSTWPIMSIATPDGTFEHHVHPGHDHAAPGMSLTC